MRLDLGLESARIADGIFTLNFMFVGKNVIPFPGFDLCGPDPTADGLTCESFTPCICGGLVGTPCDRREFCDLPPDSCTIADLPGECVPVPEACPEIFDPVCGCDGKTYGNDCERIRAGVQKDHGGPCR